METEKQTSIKFNENEHVQLISHINDIMLHKNHTFPENELYCMTF